MELLQFLFMFYLENTLLLTILVMVNPEKTMKRKQSLVKVQNFQYPLLLKFKFLNL